MANLTSPSLPEYRNPPIDEVVCGILFEPLRSFLLPHFGLLWERFRKEYPNCQEVAPLMPVIETPGTPSPQTEPTISEIPLPRVWFMRGDGRIIQVQRDRFLHNWRKLQPTDEYPRYRTVFELFQRRLSAFQDFLDEFHLGTVSPRQYELSYINLIYQGEGWETFSDIGKVFPEFCGQQQEERFLPTPSGMTWRTSFSLPNDTGRLHMLIHNAQRRDDGRPCLRFEITARGIGTKASLEEMNSWFDVAHEWIVRGFAEYTGIQIQQKVWGRKL